MIFRILILIRVGMCECLVLMRANLVCNHNRPQAGHLHHTTHTWPHTSSVCWKLNSIATSAAIISKAKKWEKSLSEEGKEKCVDHPKKWKKSGLLMCWPTNSDVKGLHMKLSIVRILIGCLCLTQRSWRITVVRMVGGTPGCKMLPATLDIYWLNPPLPPSLTPLICYDQTATCF